MEETTKISRAKAHVDWWMKNAESFCGPYFDKFARFMDLYMAKQHKYESIPAHQRANLKPPYAFQQIETMKPMIMEAIFNERPYLQLAGRQAEDIESAEIMSDYIDQQLDEVGLYEKYSDFVDTLLKTGTAIAKVPWITKERTVRRKRPIFDETIGIEIPQDVEETEVYYDNIDFQHIAITDFYPDWRATSPNVQDFDCAHRMTKSYWDLKANEKKGEEGIYINLKELYSSIADADGDIQTDAGEGEYDELKKESLDQDHVSKGLEKVKLIEWWGLFSAKAGEAPEPYVITIANDCIVIRCEKNPMPGQMKPFVAGVDYRVPGEFYGIGEIEMIESLIHEGTTMRNARLDQSNMALNRMYIVDRTAGINNRSIYSKPGGIIWANDINGIRELPPPEVTGSTYKEIGQVEFDIQNTTANINAGQSTQNMGKAFTRTATGVNYLEKFTSDRIASKIKLQEAYVLKPLITLIVSYNREFVTDDKVVRVTNKPFSFAQLPVDAFEKEYDYRRIAVSDKIMKQERQANLSMVFQTLMPFIQQYPQMFNVNNLLGDFLKEFGFRNVDRYFNEQVYQQMMGMAQQQQQQQMMQQQQGVDPSMQGMDMGGAMDAVSNLSPEEELMMQIGAGG